MKKSFAACLALLLIFLNACAGGAGPGESAPQPGGMPQASGTSQPSAPGMGSDAGAGAAGSPTVWESFSFSSEASGPEGCYIWQPRPEGGGVNIQYADYASGQLVYLCSRPECTHADESCTSFRSEGTGQISFYRGQLYVLDLNGLAGHTPYLSLCDANGENARDILPLESGSMMSNMFVSDGEAFYAIQYIYRDDSSAPGHSGRLVRMGLADGVKTNVSEKDYADANILSGIGSEIVLYTYTYPEGGGKITNPTILAVDKATGDEREIYRFLSGIVTGAKDGKAFVLRMEEEAIDVVDLATGAVQTTSFDKSAITLYDFVPDVTGMPPEDAAAMLENPPDMYYSSGMHDGKLFLNCIEDQTEDGNHKDALYAVDLTSGEVSRVTLSIGFEMRAGSPVQIVGQVGDDFFVLRDYINTPFPSVNKDGTPYEAPYITNQYALISKADFYASNPNYRDFALS